MLKNLLVVEVTLLISHHGCYIRDLKGQLARYNKSYVILILAHLIGNISEKMKTFHIWSASHAQNLAALAAVLKDQNWQSNTTSLVV